MVDKPGRPGVLALIDGMVAAGDLIAGKRGKLTRYFLSAESVAAWLATPTAPKLLPLSEQVSKHWRPKDVAPRTVEVKHTVRLMPAFDSRYGVDPATRVVGGFQSLGMGKYLDGTA